MSDKFKPGDRVAYNDGVQTDIGTILRRHEEYPEKWYALWDSNGLEQYASENALSHHVDKPVEATVTSLLQQAATLCINAKDYATAEEILMILRKGEV